MNASEFDVGPAVFVEEAVLVSGCSSSVSQQVGWARASRFFAVVLLRVGWKPRKRLDEQSCQNVFFLSCPIALSRTKSYLMHV